MNYADINENLSVLQCCETCQLKTDTEIFFAKVSLVSGLISNNKHVHRFVNLKVDATSEEIEELANVKKFTIIVNSNLEIPIDGYAFEQHITLLQL